MVILLLGLLLFVAIHMVPWSPSLRGGVISKVGELGYKGLFAILSLAGMVIAGHGYGQAETQILWTTPAFGKPVAFVLVPIAGILIVAAYAGSNIKRLTAHPMLWGVALWAFAHVINNGDTASVLLFGTIFVYSIAAMIIANKRGARPLSDKQAIVRDLISIVGGVGITLVVARYHETIFGVSVLP